MKNLIVATVCSACLACGSDGATTVGPGGSGSGGSGDPTGAGGAGGAGASDAGMPDTTGSGGSSAGAGTGGTSDAGSNGDSGTDAASLRSWTEPVARSKEGVLTNHPEFEFVSTGDLVITSAYFVFVKSSTFNSFTIFGDFENRTSVLRCVPLIDLRVGDVSVTSVGEGPEYQSPSFAVPSACYPPGAAGIFHSIANNVPLTLLDAPATVRYSITAKEPSDPAVRHPEDPIVLRPKIAEVQGGWGVTGLIQTTATPIRNFGMSFFARDLSGVLFDRALDFPGSLETLPTSSQLEFESTSVQHGVGNPIGGPFAKAEIYTSFLDVTATLPATVSSEWQQRLANVTERRRALRAAEQLAAQRIQRNSISSK